MGRHASSLLLLMLVVACGPSPVSTPGLTSSSGTRTQSSNPGLSPSPVPSAPLAVMINLSANTQTVSLVDRDGTVVAGTTTAAPDLEPVPFSGTPTAFLQGGPPGIGGVCCGVTLPEVSTTMRRAYFLAGRNQLRYLGVDGSTGVALVLPNVRGQSQAVFAVSPDDSRIAMSVFDWSTSPLKVTISVEDLDGKRRVDIFSSTSVYEWPVAWHSGDLVVAVGSVYGGAPNPYAAVSYHVADPNTGTRLATLGSTGCPAIGPIVQAGTLCNRVCTGGDVHNVAPGAQVCLDAVDWSGTQRTLLRYKDSNTIGTWAALSPNGTMAVVDDAGPPIGESLVRANAEPVAIVQVDTPVAWWLDDDTVALFGTHVAGSNGSFYRLSTAKLIPFDDSLGFVEGAVPGVS